MLKILKVTVSLDLKADRNDPDDLRDRLYESLQILMENEELEYEIGEDEEDLEIEE